MFRTLRMVKEKAIDKPTGVDADDKKRIKDIEEAAIALERTVAVYCKSFAECNANAAALHLDIANLYPANEALSVSVMTLNSSGAVFRDAGKMADDIHATLMAPLTALKDRLKTLYAKADERQVLRAEITHYREKVTRLANEGLSNTKAQAKAESNQEKLFKNQQRFRDLDAELGTELAALDHEVAEISNAAIARCVQIHATYASGLLHCYANALAAIPGAMKAGGPIAGMVVPASASAAAGGGGSAASTSPATGAARAAAGGAGASASPAASSSAPSASSHSASMSLSAFTTGTGTGSPASSSSPAASSLAAFTGTTGTGTGGRGSFTGGSASTTASASSDPMAAALAAASAVGGGAYYSGPSTSSAADGLPSAFGASVSLHGHGGFGGSGGASASGGAPNPFGDEPANPFASPTAGSGHAVTGGSEFGFDEGTTAPPPAPAE